MYNIYRTRFLIYIISRTLPIYILFTFIYMTLSIYNMYNVPPRRTAVFSPITFRIKIYTKPNVF